MTLQGVMTLPQVGEWFHQYAHRDWIKDGRAGVAYQLSWPGSLMHPVFAKMSGRVKLNLDEGTVMVAQRVYHSLVLLRLLNVLGVQSLLENISTGFSPLWVRGLPFDTVGSDFTFAQGHIQFKRLKIASSSVNLQVNGNVNTLSKKLNLLLSVKPTLTSSVPLIAGLAGGPLVGAATWLVNKLMSPMLGHAAAQEYRLTGSWDHPKLVKVPVLNTARTVV